MNAMAAEIVAFDERVHRGQVVRLWELVFGYEAAHNAPGLVIDKKLAVGDGLFWVATVDGAVVGTVMAGYDGHRGWIYSLAVHPDCRGRGIGSRLLSWAERGLASRGCVKINLQIMEGNEGVRGFYEANGYAVEKRVSMGTRVLANIEGVQDRRSLAAEGSVLPGVRMDEVEIVSGGVELLGRVAPLWHELNQFHVGVGGPLSDELAGRTFGQRREGLLAGGKALRVEIVYHGGDVGYCISSVCGGVGEIDSLYLKPRYRGRGLGRRLTESALRWMDEHGVSKKVVVALAGNESAVGFYGRFGFRPRNVKMELPNSGKADPGAAPEGAEDAEGRNEK